MRIFGQGEATLKNFLMAERFKKGALSLKTCMPGLQIALQSVLKSILKVPESLLIFLAGLLYNIRGETAPNIFQAQALNVSMMDKGAIKAFTQTITSLILLRTGYLPDGADVQP